VAAGAQHQHRAFGRGLQADHAVDVEVVAKDRLDAAQVAQFFLAHVAHEQQVAHGLHLVVVEHLEPRQQHRQAARVVGDARRVELAVALLHLHVGAGGEHGVQVGRDEQLGPVARALAQADHVAFGIDLRVGQAQRLHAREEGFGALLFLEGRRLDLGEHLQVFDRAVVVGLDRVQQLLDGGRGHQLRVGLVDLGAHLRGRGRDGAGLGVGEAGRGGCQGEDERGETKDTERGMVRGCP
jgi:hypothetical protein